MSMSFAERAASLVAARMVSAWLDRAYRAAHRVAADHPRFTIEVETSNPDELVYQLYGVGSGYVKFVIADEHEGLDERHIGAQVTQFRMEQLLRRDIERLIAEGAGAGDDNQVEAVMKGAARGG